MTAPYGPVPPPEHPAHLVTVAELLNTRAPLCAFPGPALSRCCRKPAHVPPCAALGTDSEGVAVVVTWYRPGPGAWPLAPMTPGGGGR